jgi:FSR family fosmidomycin resistance protein-like MFS transporter
MRKRKKPVDARTTMPEEQQENFQLAAVITISASHFTHDTFTAFLSPLLPLIIDKLALSLSMAGTLTAVMQIPSLLNPIVGYLDDKINLRWLMIFAPAITATLMSCLGIAPSVFTLGLLLFLTGTSSAVFHAIAPSMVTRTSGKKIGTGMSLFMAGGEMGRTLGPILAVALASLLTLQGMFPIALVGWLITLFLISYFRNIKPRPVIYSGFREIWPYAGRYFLPMFAVALTRSFMVTSLGTYLPTLLKTQGSSLWAAGSFLAVYQLAGVAGALSGGTLSDRMGRRTVLSAAMFGASSLMLMFLAVKDWLALSILIVLGLINLSIQPVLLAMTQDFFPSHRSVANGIYLTVSFLSSSISTFLIGVMGQYLGLQQAFFWSAIIGFLGIPLLLLLPRCKTARI